MSVEAPPRPPEQNELQALIEEARRRARRRRLGYFALLAGALIIAGGLYLVLGGGGGNGASSSTALGRQPLPGASAHGLRVKLGPGWHQAGKLLTPQLSNPRERFSVGTFPMHPGGCDMAPANAYSDMGPTDGLITIMERAGKGSDFPPRPAQIRLDPRPGAFECAPPDLNTQMLAFRDSGRIIYAFIALGSRGPQKEAAAILNSLRVSPASG